MNAAKPQRITFHPGPCRCLPPSAIYVGGRSLFRPPFPWRELKPAVALRRYKKWFYVDEQAELRRLARQLQRGRDLACHCKPGAACHADILLAWANADDPAEE